MLVINQNTLLIAGELGDELKKYGSSKVKLNRTSIEDDIKRVKESLSVFEQHKIKNKNKIKSCYNILNYLDDLKYASKEDEVDIEFECPGYSIDAFPIYTIKIDEPKLGLKIEFADYIEIVDPLSTLLRINYSSIMNGIVLEMCHEDLGIAHNLIEEKLHGCGPVMFNDSDRLDELGLKCSEVNGNRKYIDVVRFARELKIDDTDYYCVSKKKPLNYFSKECDADVYYNSSIESSMKYAMCIIVRYIIDLLNRHSAKARIIAVYEDEIIINLNSNKEIMAELKEPVALRVYGRRFKFPVTVEEVSL